MNNELTCHYCDSSHDDSAAKEDQCPALILKTLIERFPNTVAGGHIRVGSQVVSAGFTAEDHIRTVCASSYNLNWSPLGNMYPPIRTKIVELHDATANNAIVGSVTPSLTIADQALVAEIKERGEDFLNFLTDAFPQGREIALAKTKIDEAVMWAVKGATK